MKYARRDFPCIRGYIRPGKASLLKTPIFNLLITRHKSAPNLQGTKPAVWLAVRSVSCQPVSPGFLSKLRGKNRGKIARVQGRACGRICGSVQARNFLPDSCFPCGTGLRSGCRERVLPGWQPALIGCQLRPCRPDIADRRFTPRPACLPADHPCMEPQTGPDRRAGLPDRKRRDQDGGKGSAAHGVGPGLPCGGVTGRTGPAHVNQVIGHRHPDICPDETRGRAIPPAQAGAGPRPGPHVRPACWQQGRCSSGRPCSRMQGDPCPSPASAAHGPAPAIPVLPPANRTGPVKPGPLIDAAICRTRSAERVRDFRAQGTGFQGTGTSGGSRPVSGMRAGPERVPSREGFFAAGHAGPPDVFSPSASREFGREPSGGFPARFRGHFVLDGKAFRFG